jgi:hypothetical protein
MVSVDGEGADLASRNSSIVLLIAFIVNLRGIARAGEGPLLWHRSLVISAKYSSLRVWLHVTYIDTQEPCSDTLESVLNYGQALPTSNVLRFSCNNHSLAPS